MAAGHGNTPAAWTAVGIAMLGFVVGSVALLQVPTQMTLLWIGIIIAVVAIGVGYYSFHGTLQTKATELSPTARGTAVALFAFSLFLGQGLGAAAMGTTDWCWKKPRPP